MNTDKHRLEEPRDRANKHILKAGAVYYAVVFRAGFALGPVRIDEKQASGRSLF